jgi:predicted DsbA family dithiol-disulfide isomerase
LYPEGRHEITNWGERLDALYPGGRRSILSLGEKAGFSFNMDAPLSDTMDSHRLYLFAEAQGRKGEDLAQCIGHQYFERGKPLADRDMLCACAREVGLDEGAARAYLEGEGGVAEVRENVRQNLRLGIHSIPVFVFRSAGFETVVRGSADVATFGRVLDAILSAAAEQKHASKDET